MQEISSPAAVGTVMPAMPTIDLMPEVIVIDAIPGAGKTTLIHRHMNEAHELDLAARAVGDRDEFDPPARFLFVTPLLEEVERVREKCPALRFRDPMPVHGQKFFDLERLIEAGENIATTHVLFSMLTPAVVERLRERGYTLVIDEVLTCVDYFKYDEDDLTTLFDQQMVYVDQHANLRWNHKRWPAYDGKHLRIKHLCDCGNLVAWSMYKDGFTPGAKGSLLLWAFPTTFLTAFEQVFILTYLFTGSPMRAYLDAQGVDFTMTTVVRGREDLAPWSNGDEREQKARIRSLLKVYDGPLNKIGTRRPKTRANPLSKGWFKSQGDAGTMAVRNAAINYFRQLVRNSDVTTREIAWTTFRDQRKKLAGVRYKHHTQWIPLNAKATNEYAHKSAVAYLANRFSLPEIEGYFNSHGIHVCGNVYAASEMLQWIWRSAIRNNEVVNVFVPSRRMRELLRLWLACDSAPEFVARAAEFNAA